MAVSMHKYESIIKEIADSHDCGLTAFVYRETLRTLYLPSESNVGWEIEPDDEDYIEIEENFHLMIKLEPPESHESFAIMESFAEELPEGRLKDSLFSALNQRRPFANFKHLVDHTEVREDWFLHKARELQKRVKFELDTALKTP